MSEQVEFTARVEGGGETPFWVCAKDAAWVGLYRWNCNLRGYIYRRSTVREDGVKKSYNVYLHREVVGLEKGDGWQVDHLNTDRLDCTRPNLEIVTAKENVRRRDARMMNF